MVEANIEMTTEFGGLKDLVLVLDKTIELKDYKIEQLELGFKEAEKTHQKDICTLESELNNEVK